MFIYFFGALNFFSLACAHWARPSTYLGINVILHGRKAAALEKVRKEILAKYRNIDVRYIEQGMYTLILKLQQLTKRSKMSSSIRNGMT